MTPDQIIQRAREAGAGVDQTGFGPVISFSGPQLTRFAQLVASHKQEQCAVVCEAVGSEYDDQEIHAGWCAAAIRALKD